jgi:hypothetical protein
MSDEPRDNAPLDPMGFRLLRARWNAAPDLPPPVPTAAQAEAFSEALAADFDRFLHEAGVRRLIEDEAARRLASLVKWTCGRRSWTP